MRKLIIVIDSGIGGKDFMKKLKERWGVTSNKQIVVIFIVFAITGFSSLQLAKPFLTLIGISETFQPHWLYRVLRIILIFPIYQKEHIY